MEPRDEFFSLIDTAQTKSFTLPSGREIFAGALTALDRVEVRIDSARAREANGGQPDKLAVARVIVRAMHDGKGNMVFKKTIRDEEGNVIAGDEAKIMAMPGYQVDELLGLIDAVNLTGATSQAEAKKNSAATPASPGASPATSAAPTSASSSPA